ncbi:alpha/beta fold hydrolase [Pseudoblastomonas flavescens]|uniref:alpha/beta fold hydrolase n=1 Tax=Alteriqipengyuania flavescens TaxID=3053610 RepID=UPI00384F9A99
MSTDLGQPAALGTPSRLRILKSGGPANTSARVVIGWGRKDRPCLPQQADCAAKALPEATMHWFERSGHFPMLDQPEETVRVILDATSIYENNTATGGLVKPEPMQGLTPS